MSANVESMFAVGERTWHGEETLLAQAPTTAEGIRLAGLDWHVECVALQTVDGEPVHHKATRRTDNGRILGVVGPDWTPVQNARAFGFFDPMISAGFAKLETAASLHGGRRIFVLAKVGTADIGGGDEIAQYVLLANGHDGSLAVRAGLTSTRVVCANTLAVAIGRGRNTLARLSHTKGVLDGLDEVQNVMEATLAAHASAVEQYRFLASAGISTAQLREYVDAVFERAKAKPAPQAAKPDDFSSLMSGGYRPEAPSTTFAIDPEPIEKGDRLMREIIARFEGGPGQELETARGTWWGAYNAVTDYLSHGRSKNPDTRTNSVYFGQGAEVNQRALASAVKMASA